MSAPKQYRKKPVVIWATRWDGTVEAGLEIINDFASEAVYVEYVASGGEVTPDRIVIPTLEGEMAASPGDFIIQGVNGEFYPCKPDIFEKTYEAVNG